MKILIEIPTWLGDAVMATPAIENLIKHYKDVEITIVGSYVSVEALKYHPNVVKSVVLDKKYRLLYKTAKSLDYFDLAISFRSSFRSKVFLYFINAKQKFQFSKKYKNMHQVEKYNTFMNDALQTDYPATDLKLYVQPFHYDKPTLGINPGATYGSAKRWYPEEFAKVAIALSKNYDIIIFGGPTETEIAKDIEKQIRKSGVGNVENLAGKTSIEELISKIAGLSRFITNDSGPMHIAAAYKIPTIAIFGPTKDKETNQWKNPQGIIVKKEMDCAPCMKRTCPLKHHECMKLIKAEDVLKAMDQNASSIA
ncbi:MAG: ADP-heptose--LPS heptosyltransferase [Epsilonproteobacteria bacterium (ex Lamellibrachia satsuma)]|nr:MAG: ADP-heptose--LPS heptosyltransferase [Epsilonproteobacteria bacterium (ex Lamellibrachia satsuma)]